MRRHEPQSREPVRAPASRAGLALLAGIVLLVSLGWLAAPAAWAHVTLESSTPAEGQQLEEVPPSVTLKFSGDLDFDAGAEVTVMGPDGASLQVGTTIVSADTLIQRLNDQRDAVGLYTVEYAATSVDGHEVAGRLGFYVGAAGGEQPTEGAAEGGSATQAPGLVERSDDSSDDGSGVPALAWVALAAVALLAVGGVLWARTHRRPAAAAPAPPVPPRARPVGKSAAARPQPRQRRRR
ncbi:copper resistance protein CopC [Nocardioides dongxiaopingii]|uniref:copper resistance CopC family protein n=1 Tax=Nocardioides sp. S-1144 TaxID=2582905 RepID=UPI001164E95F|nr:copper resistance protein CopC [Nocardioides sp. S-1144]QCW49565.2 copper resistance protein CopC [Nocardioides sp. S-1144]